MRDPFTRGSAPERARGPSQRSGSFKPGQEKVGGRKKGTPNKTPRATKQLLLEVACQVGSDGNGKDGLVGYYKWLAKSHPKIFLTQLGRLLVLETRKSSLPGCANETPTAFECNETLRKQTTELLRGRPPLDTGLFEDLASRHPNRLRRWWGRRCWFRRADEPFERGQGDCTRES
jgi:hypothetical protein